MRLTGRQAQRSWLAALFLLALALRLWRARQCLWGDEMESLLHYVAGPWRVVVAAGPGQYVPNDHVLYAALAKVCLTLGANGRIDPADTAAFCVRLPSIVAGSLVPIALAWPLRRRAPGVAVLLGLIAAVHPWLVAQGGEARGYALMTLLGIVATNLLPGSEKRWPFGYAVAIALALYTVPVALLLVAGHGLVALAQRGKRANWLRGATMGAVLTALLYAPMASGLADYYRHPLSGPDDNVDFANQLPRFALAGRYVPASYDPATHVPDPRVGAIYWLVPVSLLVAGTAAAHGRVELWPTMAPLIATTAVATALPLLLPASGQVRFVPWAGLCTCVAIAALLLWLGDRFGRITARVGAVGTSVALLLACLGMPPEQPAREAIAEADRLAPPGAPVVIAFFTADESALLYAGPSRRHAFVAAGPPPAFAAVEAQVRRASGHRPWLVISFEFLLRDIRPDVWRYVNAHYHLVDRLAGRTSPVAIYAPVD